MIAVETNNSRPARVYLDEPGEITVSLPVDIVDVLGSWGTRDASRIIDATYALEHARPTAAGVEITTHLRDALLDALRLLTRAGAGEGSHTTGVSFDPVAARAFASAVWAASFEGDQ